MLADKSLSSVRKSFQCKWCWALPLLLLLMCTLGGSCVFAAVSNMGWLKREEVSRLAFMYGSSSSFLWRATLEHLTQSALQWCSLSSADLWNTPHVYGMSRPACASGVCTRSAIVVWSGDIISMRKRKKFISSRWNPNVAARLHDSPSAHWNPAAD